MILHLTLNLMILFYFWINSLPTIALLRSHCKDVNISKTQCKRRFLTERARIHNVENVFCGISLGKYLRSLNDIRSTESQIVIAISKACSDISTLIETAPLKKLLGYTEDDTFNESGERQRRLDLIAESIFQKHVIKCGVADILVSEEAKEPIIVNANKISSPSKEKKSQRFLIAYDPLDGSSNIDCNAPTGTIFAIYEYMQSDSSIGDSAVVNPSNLIGKRIIGSGYALYSSSTELVICLEKNVVHGFTLNPKDQEWYLSRPNITCPNRGVYYSLNEGRYSDWTSNLQRYIDNIKNGKSQSGKRYSSRYICSLVADVHRTLLYGGWAGNPRSHLRLLYEAAPLAFICENSGGAASDGINRILDIIPDSFHHRLPLFLGSKLDIEELMSYGDVQQKTGNVKYEY